MRVCGTVRRGRGADDGEAGEVGARVAGVETRFGLIEGEAESHTRVPTVPTVVGAGQPRQRCTHRGSRRSVAVE